jgi:hypothetical protein
MLKITFARWLTASGPPARWAVLAGAAALIAPLAMAVAPASANPRPASASTEAGTAEPARLAVDELSSRRHGAGSRSSGGGRRGGILGGARGAFKKSAKSVASRGHAGRHHAGRNHANRRDPGRRADPPNFDPRAAGLARLQQRAGAYKKTSYRHRKGDGFGKYGLQPDGGYSSGSGVGSKKTGGRHRDARSGGYGDRSFYKIRDTFRKAARRDGGRRQTPAYVGGNYGGRSFGPRAYQ